LKFFLLSLSLGIREDKVLLFFSKGDYFKVLCVFCPFLFLCQNSFSVGSSEFSP
ncbi:unnamed protein product, partial [Arabidopsis halleri]